jgi:hypothetical protein
MSKIAGGCLCGKVRYSAPGEPVLTAVCHCKNCQKQTGTSFSVIISVPSLALSVKGTLKTFDHTGDGEKPVHKNFCPDCGSPINVDRRIEAGAVVHQSWDAGRRELAETHCGNLVRERSALGIAG